MLPPTSHPYNPNSPHLPQKFQTWHQTWKTHHPTWHHILWSDHDNRRLISTHYPWFLPYYDRLPSAITRADASRYFYMHHYGGIYVDLDSECLKPFDTLLSDAPAYVASMTGDMSFDHDIPNAWLASSKGHPFWLHVVGRIMGNVDSLRQGGAEEVTGPVVLMKAWRDYHSKVPGGEREPIKLLDKGVIYPYSWNNAPPGEASCWGGESNSAFDPDECKRVLNSTGKLTNQSHMITYWTHSWKDEN
ncbi:hypothetical protein HK097_003292 [Rhizophlyctis rosea]|uniref:Glycosyltransferase family 32 protein n=1 Tax=Rhizophlyctis rosea TaxID=64517 RepID=A0AAD5SME2_9FUNG|nr:hypothetical protein HK097_003292 [Rhizophlyctis rosea]